MLGPSTYRLQWRAQLARRYRAVSIGLAVVLAIGILAPVGLSQETTPVVTGHSSFYNGDSFDTCLASVVGIMRMRVMWFNHQVLVERYSGDGTYIYATELGAPNPTADGVNLVSSGIFYDFVDPNGVHWRVDEAYWEEEVNTVPVDATVSTSPTPSADAEAKPVLVKRWYTWIVEVGRPVRDQYPGASPHDFYNFVTILNTCKFRKDNLDNSTRMDVPHPGGMGVDTGHLKNDGAHTHESYAAALWTGVAPRILPAGTETPYKAAADAGLNADATRPGGPNDEEFNHNDT